MNKSNFIIPSYVNISNKKQLDEPLSFTPVKHTSIREQLLKSERMACQANRVAKKYDRSLTQAASRLSSLSAQIEGLLNEA